MIYAMQKADQFSRKGWFKRLHAKRGSVKMIGMALPLCRDAVCQVGVHQFAYLGQSRLLTMAIK